MTHLRSLSAATNQSGSPLNCFFLMSQWETLLPLSSLFILITHTSEHRGWIFLHPRACFFVRIFFFTVLFWDDKLTETFYVPLRSTDLALVSHKYSRTWATVKKPNCHQIHILPGTQRCLDCYIHTACLDIHKAAYSSDTCDALISQNVLWSSDLFVCKLEDVKTIRDNLRFVLEQMSVKVSCS